jgi:hypothetical protein
VLSDIRPHGRSVWTALLIVRGISGRRAVPTVIGYRPPQAHPPNVETTSRATRSNHTLSVGSIVTDCSRSSTMTPG